MSPPERAAAPGEAEGGQAESLGGDNTNDTPDLSQSSRTGIPDRHPRGPEANRLAARALGFRGANAIQILSANHDPFYKGTPGHIADAEWFRSLWDEFGYTTGVHPRRVHYQALSTGKRLPNGAVYENTELHWARLSAAAASARILGLVDVEAFDDRRNSPAIVNRPDGLRLLEPPRIGFYSAPWEVPDLDLSPLVEAVTIAVPVPYPYGYAFEDSDDRPTLIELWVEKSTMSDVLVPLCEREHANLVAGAGFESITHVAELVRRAEHFGGPAHIIYVSDFDPAGDQMPVAVARQVQFWRERLDVDQRVTLETVALTRDQCIEYELPRIPIKESDRRRRGFEDRYGEGATELDALEALRPGTLAQIVGRAIRQHRDQGFAGRVVAAASEARDLVDAAWEQADGAEIEAEARRLTDQARVAVAGLTEEINELISERINELEPLREAADELVRRAEQIAATLAVDLPERPTPEVVGPSDDVLFDSERHWADQLQVFRSRKLGALEEVTA